MGEYIHQKFNEQLTDLELKYCTDKIIKPKVSVIIPIFNVENYIEECLKSLINQTLIELEFICVIDGSTDNSAKIVYEYAQKDSRFIIIEQDNLGQGIARNKAINIAKGEYLAFVDPDDWVSYEIFEKTYSFAKKNNSDVVQFNYTEYNEYSKKFKPISFAKHLKKQHSFNIKQTGKYNKNDIKHGLFFNLDLHVWNRLYKRDFICSNKIQFAPTKNGEDHLFVNGVILFANDIYFIDEYLYFYRTRKNSIVNTKTFMNGVYAFEDIKHFKNFLEVNNLYNQYNIDFDEYSIKILYWHYHQLPLDYIDEYEKQCKEFLSNDNYVTFTNLFKEETTFIQKIFSLKNKKENGEKFKILRILGLKFILNRQKSSNQEGTVNA